MSNEGEAFMVPEDAVFKKAPILPHDAAIKPQSGAAWHLNGNSANGDIVEYLHEEDGKIIHEMKQDIEPSLKHAEALRNEGGMYAGMSVKNGVSNDMRHSAHVDQIVVVKWLQKRNMNMSHFKGQVITDFLNDPENAPFRVWRGRV